MAETGVQVLAQLGPMPEYARHYAEQAAAMMPGYRTVLLADQRSGRPLSGVERISLASVVTSAEIADLDRSLMRAGFDLSYRRGYWRKVFLRFLSIRNFLNASPSTGSALHLESDVSSFVTPTIVEQFLTGCSGAFVPMHDEGSACPSIILGATSRDLADAMDVVVQAIGTRPGQSDMTILGQAANDGLIATLPTRVRDSLQNIDVMPWQADGSSGPGRQARVIYDAAAVGQFLFGLDPRNNSGVLVPGYRETRGGVDPGTWTDWHLVSCTDGVTRVAVTDGDELAVLALLHVHAKTTVERPAAGSHAWAQCLSIANHERGAKAVVRPSDYARYQFGIVSMALRRRRRRLVALVTGRGAKGSI